MSVQSYIYDKKEYVKTGRIATKQESRGSFRGKENSSFVKELIEIRPINVPENNTEFNIWVESKDLFEVINE